MKKQFLAYAFALTLCVQAFAQSNSPDGNFTASGNATSATPNLTLNTMVSGTVTPRLSILAAPGITAGFVGIGIPNPSDLLHVNGNVRANQFNLISGILTTIGTGNLSFRTNNTARMTILGATSGSRLAGFVGLNTTTPDDWLHVNGNIRANQFNSVSGVLNTIGATNLSFRTNNTARMTILSSGINAGFVGIGITSPDAVLDVAGRGDGSATDFRVGGRIQSNSAYGGVWLSNTNDGLVGNNGENIGFYTIGTGWNTFQINKTTGNVGIGTTSPVNKLQIGSNPSGWVGNDFVLANGNGALAINTDATNTYLWGLGDISIRPGNTGNPSIYAKSDGTVGIGTMLTSNPNSYKLAVNGKIGAKDVQIETTSSTWPDFVFKKDYKLTPLAEVEEYINQNKHLKEVPTAEQIEKQGYLLGEMDKILLKKIEELTLYIIQQQKEIQELKKRMGDDDGASQKK